MRDDGTRGIRDSAFVLTNLVCLFPFLILYYILFSFWASLLSHLCDCIRCMHSLEFPLFVRKCDHPTMVVLCGAFCAHYLNFQECDHPTRVVHQKNYHRLRNWPWIVGDNWLIGINRIQYYKEVKFMGLSASYQLCMCTNSKIHLNLILKGIAIHSRVGKSWRDNMSFLLCYSNI